MSESEDEVAPASSAPAAEDDGPLYPLEGKFTSEKDRADIMAMPELQRETVLAERAAEQERRRQNNTLKQLREARQKASAAALRKRKVTDAELDETPRKTTKAKTKATETLEAYKKKREQVKDQRQRNADRKAGDPDSPRRDEEESDRDAEGEEDVEWDEPVRRAPAKNEPEADMRDYERIRVGRTNFARVCFYPGFEDAIKGCFTRVCIGPDKQTNQNLYRMCQIKSK
jgi:RNA polymerase-associated protein RTF1